MRVTRQIDPASRQPHAITDVVSRRLKALKIELILGRESFPRPTRLLEIGTGSGGIAHYFATHPTLDCDVTAVDVNDNRQVCDGYNYLAVQGVELPFEEAQFDVVITNHVIEHVGDAADQLKHLREIYRVLTSDGVGYIAVPNRWMLTEPHYRLKFLSWLPHSWRTPYLKLWRKGEFYDCEPLQLKQLEHMLDAAGLSYCNAGTEALRLTFEIEKPHAISTRILRRIPNWIINFCSRIMPTLIYRIRKGNA